MNNKPLWSKSLKQCQDLRIATYLYVPSLYNPTHILEITHPFHTLTWIHLGLILAWSNISVLMLCQFQIRVLSTTLLIWLLWAISQIHSKLVSANIAENSDISGVPTVRADTINRVLNYSLHATTCWYLTSVFTKLHYFPNSPLKWKAEQISGDTSKSLKSLL